MFWNKDSSSQHFQGWPDTRIEKDKVVISTRYMTPETVKTQDAMMTGGGLTGLVLGFMGGAFIGAAVGAVALAILGKELGKSFMSRVEVAFTEKEILIKTENGGWEKFDRTVPHQFGMEQHQAAEEEAGIDAWTRTTPDPKNRKITKRIYRDSYHVFLDHIHTKFYFPDVYLRKTANLFFNRLKGVDEYMQNFRAQDKTSDAGIDPFEGRKKIKDKDDSPSDSPEDNSESFSDQLKSFFGKDEKKEPYKLRMPKSGKNKNVSEDSAWAEIRANFDTTKKHPFLVFINWVSIVIGGLIFFVFAVSEGPEMYSDFMGSLPDINFDTQGLGETLVFLFWVGWIIFLIFLIALGIKNSGKKEDVTPVRKAANNREKQATREDLKAAWEKVKDDIPENPEIGILPDKPDFYDDPEFRAEDFEQPATDNERESVSLRGLEELQNMIGLETVKREIKTLADLAVIQKMREENNLPTSKMSFHMVFTGNPGTGKTRVARLVGDIFREIRILKKGHVVEVDQSGMIGKYMGSTAPKTTAKIEEAFGGVLFIDEAYALTKDSSNTNYGAECIEILLKMMEDHRDKFIVIAAGYPEEMERFVNFNPGLQSRFNKFIHFPDYGPDEMQGIFLSLCDEHEYMLTEEATNKAEAALKKIYENRGKHFGNGRTVRKFFEKCNERQARRLVRETRNKKKSIFGKKELSRSELSVFLPEDIPPATEFSGDRDKDNEKPGFK